MGALLWPIVVMALSATSASSAAESLPHGIPDFCAGSPDAVPAGQSVTLSGPVEKGCLGIHGTVTLTGDLVVDTILVYKDGFLDVKSGASITFRNTPIDTTVDPEQYATGLIALGKVRMRGDEKTPFVRLAAEVRAGQTRLTLASAPAGWKPGDRLVLPDTRQLEEPNWIRPGFVGHWETVHVVAVTDSTVTLSAPVNFDHLPARTESGAIFAFPHVANLTRSVVVRSANPAGTRGHQLFTGRADVDIRWVELQQLGRTTVKPLDCTLRATDASEQPHICNPGTGPVRKIGKNHIGRYALHMHHHTGPVAPQPNGYQFTLVGNVVDTTPKWGITIHNSHYGLVADNVIYNADGAALMTEDGSETGNVIERNFALRGFGSGGREGGGREGVGFYFRGPNNVVRDNVAANFYSDTADSAYGYKYYQTYLGVVRIPTKQGAESTTSRDGNAMAIREFARNEVYASESGLTYWWVGSFWEDPRREAGESVFKDLRVWHVFNKGIFHYPSHRVTIDGLVAHMDPKRAAVSGTGIEGADYMASEWKIVNPEISYFAGGISLSSVSTGAPQIILGGRLRNTQNISLTPPMTSGYRADVLPPRLVTVVGTRFETPAVADTKWLDGVKAWLAYNFRTNGQRNFVQRDEVTVVDFNGTPGDTFRWFFPQQAPEFVVPTTSLNSDGTPSQLGAKQPGLTNQESWTRNKVAIAGSVAPCTTTREHVTGFTCPVSAPVVAPRAVQVSAPRSEERHVSQTRQVHEGHGTTESRTVDPCVQDPLVVTDVIWPDASDRGGSVRFSTGNKAWRSFAVLWPDTLDVTDARGCVATVRRSAATGPVK